MVLYLSPKLREENKSMKIHKEESLSNFEFWSGAKDNVEKLTSEELDQIESNLEDLYPDGMDETQINDLFWFEFDTVLEWIGKEECPDCGELIDQGETCECQEKEEETEDQDLEEDQK
jgi:hypothetical protein